MEAGKGRMREVSRWRQGERKDERGEKMEAVKGRIREASILRQGREG